VTDSRQEDLQHLDELLEQHLDELLPHEKDAFTDMRSSLAAYGNGVGRRQLSDRQRAWVKATLERVVPQYENLVSRGLVPRGKEVPTPEVLKKLPMRPPKKVSSTE